MSTAVLCAAFTPAIASAAAPVPVTAPAISITTNGAELTGVIAPGGNAVTYEFQYGTTATYGSVTSPITLGAQATNETVSASIGGLKAGTTYHFRLAVSIQSQGGTTTAFYYYTQAYSGNDVTFTTKTPGQLTLGASKVKVKKGVAAILLKCASTQACKGKLVFSKRVRVGRSFKNETLGSKSFSLNANKKGTIKVPVNKVGRALLLFAKHHTLSGVKLAGTFTTGQKTFSHTIKLIS